MELSEKLVDKIKGSYGSQLLRKKALDEEVEFLVQTSRRIRREWLEFLKDKKERPNNLYLYRGEATFEETVKLLSNPYVKSITYRKP